MRRLLVDVTRTVQAGLHTGIQRVVRRLWHALHASEDALQLEVLAVAFEGDQWRNLGYLPSHTLEGGASKPAATTQLGVRIAPGSGDVLLMADASWYVDPWPAVDAALANGAELVGFVHDLFPLDEPQWFKPELQPRFAEHFERLSRRAALLLTPSHAVKQAVMSRLARPEYGGQRHDFGGVLCLPLGADFLQTAGSNHLPGPLTGDDDYVLMVGTVEPRKNHALVLDVFEQLWQQGHTRKLVIVGAPGWCSDSVLARLHNHNEQGKRMHWLNRQGDAELHALYTHARALVFPSLNEGFGLPLAEAAHLGCPVLCSDIPVLREVGGHWPTYLPLEDVQQWVNALGQLTAPACEKAPTRTWNTVAAELADVLRNDDTQLVWSEDNLFYAQCIFA
jgi:glycosyltransferase involved in cell wall biosynthesis